jgi:tellurite resistance protein
MGIGGTGLAWRVGNQVVGAPAIIGEAMLATATLVFIALSVLYATKAMVTPHLVTAEVSTPSSASQFACISISLLMLSTGALPYSRSCATVVWMAGAILQLLLCLWLLGRWIEYPTALSHATPTWLIPIVGNVVAVTSGSRLGFQEISWFFFSIGVVCWIAFLPILLYRMIFHHEPMADAAAPSIAIFVSPPAVGALAWLQLGGMVDGTFRVLLFSALFFAILALRLFNILSGARVSAAWWAYTFPAAALAWGFVLYSRVLEPPFAHIMAWTALILVTTIVLLVIVGTTLIGVASICRRPSPAVRAV